MPASSSRDAAAIYVAIKSPPCPSCVVYRADHSAATLYKDSLLRRMSGSGSIMVQSKKVEWTLGTTRQVLNRQLFSSGQIADCHCHNSLAYTLSLSLHIVFNCIHTHSSPLVFPIFAGISTIRNTTTGKTTWHFCFSSSF